MKIATYNINGVNGRLEILLKWLKKAKPDVVCLQELKCPQNKFPLHAINKAGYQAIWHGEKSWNGVRYYRVLENRLKLGGYCRVILKISIAGTWKPSSTISSW